jgi:hypothetical protein
VINKKWTASHLKEMVIKIPGMIKIYALQTHARQYQWMLLLAQIKIRIYYSPKLEKTFRA